MTTWVQVSCDRVWSDGSCPRQSWPAHTIEAARARAEADGWYLKPDRDLCPWHAGRRT